MDLSKVKCLAAFAFLVLALPTSARSGSAVWVRGYWRSDGTYVRPHWRSAPDGNPWNNWSTYPNINPFTGKIGTVKSPILKGYRRRSIPSWRSYTYRSKPWASTFGRTWKPQRSPYSSLLGTSPIYKPTPAYSLPKLPTLPPLPKLPALPRLPSLDLGSDW